MSNFKFPYFSRDIGEFWRRWHISLSTWFRDYLYIPLGGSKGGKWLSIRNIFIIFIVSGFWHGANWTFIMWGLIHAVLYIPLFLRGKNRRYTTNVVAEHNMFPSLKELFQMGSTFFFTMIAWVFFRSESVLDGFNYLSLMVIKFSAPQSYTKGLFLVLIMVFLDWSLRKNERSIQFNWLGKLPTYPRYVIITTSIIVSIFLISWNKNIPTPFLYFQF